MLSLEKKKELVVEVIERIKELLNAEQINLLGRKITDLVEADGMVMSGEVEIVQLIEEHLNIKIKYDLEI